MFVSSFAVFFSAGCGRKYLAFPPSPRKIIKVFSFFLQLMIYTQCMKGRANLSFSSHDSHFRHGWVVPASTAINRTDLMLHTGRPSRPSAFHTPHTSITPRPPAPAWGGATPAGGGAEGEGGAGPGGRRRQRRPDAGSGGGGGVGGPWGGGAHGGTAAGAGAEDVHGRPGWFCSGRGPNDPRPEVSALVWHAF